MVASLATGGHHRRAPRRPPRMPPARTWAATSHMRLTTFCLSSVSYTPQLEIREGKMKQWIRKEVDEDV
ncbi:hypothetical protein Cni_G07315 [Canna indica]|uniref:Uncharacterized protein n=1 Tax=Canna indica TaxID=4628 RepID=A0AAQ3Q5L8_9LILI|nr:hypothetical protein Cni_G07315 [Canna indica]